MSKEFSLDDTLKDLEEKSEKIEAGESVLPPEGKEDTKAEKKEEVNETDKYFEDNYGVVDAHKKNQLKTVKTGLAGHTEKVQNAWHRYIQLLDKESHVLYDATHPLYDKLQSDFYDIKKVLKESGLL